jgi:hypothetical protein
MKKKLTPFLAAAAIVFLAGTLRLFAGAGEKSSAPERQPPPAPSPAGVREPGSGEPGEEETRAFALAYPTRIAERAFRNGEWALRIDEAWYSWANGRMLPEAEKERWNEFAVLRVYRYPAGLPPVARLDEEAKTRLRQRLAEDREKPPARSEAFLSHLLEASTRQEAEARLVRVSLMGFNFRLHELAAESLRKVDKEARELAAADEELRRFFAGISHIGSFNWRPIAGTGSRSYHGYGLALDFIAKNWGGKAYYWRNIMNANPEWFHLPYEKRWMVPLSLTRLFEKHGFIWGGKWLYFDTVHFEYRPELFILSGRRNESAPRSTN